MLLHVKFLEPTKNDVQALMRFIFEKQVELKKKVAFNMIEWKTAIPSATANINRWRVRLMKTFERLLIKVIIIQLACLFFSNSFLSREDQIIDLTKLSNMSVTSNNYTKIIETFNGTDSKSGD